MSYGYTLAEQTKKKLEEGRIKRIEEAKIKITNLIFCLADERSNPFFRIELDKIDSFLNNNEVEQIGKFFIKEGFEVSYNYAYGHGPGSKYAFITLKIA